MKRKKTHMHSGGFTPSPKSKDNLFGFSSVFQQKPSSLVGGFTLIEVLVSVALFTVVAVTGTTAVIVAKASYERNQSIKTTTDSLMFILEDISRTARLGTNYRCLPISGVPTVDLETIEIAQNSPFPNDCDGVAYEPFWNADGGDPSDQIIYVFAETENGVGALFARSINDTVNGGTIGVLDTHFQRITPHNLDIDIDRSGFDIFGAEDPELGLQPRIILRMVGTIQERSLSTELSLQTTISQRAIRVEP